MARSDLGCTRLSMQKLEWKKWALGWVELWASSSTALSLGPVEIGRRIFNSTPRKLKLECDRIRESCVQSHSSLVKGLAFILAMG